MNFNKQKYLVAPDPWIVKIPLEKKLLLWLRQNKLGRE